MSGYIDDNPLVGQTIHIGVVLFPFYQLLDAAGPIDYLNNHSKAMVTNFHFPPHLIPKATIIHWYYLAESLEKPIQPSSGPPQQATHTFANPPSELNYLLVPGSDPMMKLSPTCISFFRNVFPQLRALLTVCTGSLILAQTGLLAGHSVCSNKWVLREFAKAGALKQEPYSDVTWIGDRRWIIDRKTWSAAGVTAGIDLIAEFARLHFDPEIVELVKEISEESPKPDRPDDWAHMLNGVDLAPPKNVGL